MKILQLTTLDTQGPECPDTDKIKFDSKVFPGGEPHFRMTDNLWKKGEEIVIVTRVNSFNDLGMLAVAVDAIQRIGNYSSLTLHLPYFPGARQDRVCNPGEALTVDVYATAINSMNFSEVMILDPHSDVAPALLDNVTVRNNHTFVEACIHDLYGNSDNNMLLISPDAGANKKIKDLAAHLNDDFFIEVVKCDKTRNLSDGSISGFEVYADDLEGKDCLIVDDICDGGGTFLGLAQELKDKKAGDLYLVVTHGIFSKGFMELNKYFKGIYTTDSFFTQTNEAVKQINLRDL